MSCGTGTPYALGDPRMPRQQPIRLQGQGGSGSSYKPSSSSPSPPSAKSPDGKNSNTTTTTIENGRIVHQSRRTTFIRSHLRRIGQLLRDPRQITYREICGGVVFGGYALYTLLQTLRAIAYFDTIWLALCLTLGSEEDSSPGECVKYSAVMTGMMVVDWLRRVVPWGFVCVAVIFVGEEVLRRRR